MPTMHFTIAEGFVKATTVGQMGWFFLMAVMYITGAGLYAARIPERFFPGKFDIWVRKDSSTGLCGASAQRWRSEAEGPGAGGVWGDACPCSRRCVWAGESLAGVTLFFSYNKFISLWCRTFCGGTTRRGKCLLSLAQLLAIALKLLFCPHSSSLIRSSMSW